MRPPLEVPLRDEVKILSHYGEDRIKSILKVVYQHFDYYSGHRSVRWFGWMSHHVFEKYLGKMGFSGEDIENIFKLLRYDPSVCPLCGLPLVLVAEYCNNILVMDFKPPPKNVIVWGSDRSDNPRYSISVHRRVEVEEELVPHTFADLKDANPLMPDWMIEQFIRRT